MKESLEKKIEIQGFDFNVVQLIVDFAYGKTISIDIENAEVSKIVVLSTIHVCACVRVCV